MHAFKSAFSSPHGALGLVLIIFVVGCGRETREAGVPFDLSQATYVGRDKCAECHREQAEAFVNSHHDLAMQPANSSTVLGDFSGVTLEHLGIVSRMFQRDGKYWVHTEGPDGSLQDFEVKYVFGVDPLQQYMVEFPSAQQRASSNQSSSNQSTSSQQHGTTVPRLQVLGVCWDTLQQRWFYLMPPDVSDKLEPDDELHWTGLAQRWNTMCADCHSTNYAKNFQLPAHPVARTVSSRGPSQDDSTGTTTDQDELETDSYGDIAGEYHSSFFEIDVSCEACHGPGSVHVELAGKWMPGWNRTRGYGLANLKASPENQIQACAPCHSRRQIVQAGFQAGDNYYDHFTNALLIDPVYYADGQVLDEDYVHGSFIQSKMYHKGIQCSDCHDPHTARLKHTGNAVCTSCHQHPAAKYDSVAHHFHASPAGTAPENDGTLCVNCHMPTTTYMQVDARRDHSLRVPRPDLSLKIGTPNACTSCHLNLEAVAIDKRPGLKLYQDWMQAGRQGDVEVQTELERANRWCDEACDRWYGETRRRDEHFGEALAAAQTGAPDAAQKLIKLLRQRGAEAPAIARATALELLMPIAPRAASQEASEGMADPHPLVRHSAARVLLAGESSLQSQRLLVDALSDPIRSVRTQAARSLLQLAPEQMATTAGPAFRRALEELEAGIKVSSDHAGAHVDLGVLAEGRGLQGQAIKHYEMAITVDPRFVGPRANLADLLERSAAQNSSAGHLPELVKRLRQEELPLVERNARLLPKNAELQYRYALALYLDGQLDKASELAIRAAELAPTQVEYAQIAAMLFESLKKYDQAIKWAEEANRRSGNSAESQALLERIKAGARTP